MGVFILPPSEDDLLKRLRDRGRDDEATILRRFTEARQEIRTARNCGAYDLMVVNYDNGVDRTVEEIERAIRDYHKGV
jgi:guanylate kinase